MKNLILRSVMFLLVLLAVLLTCAVAALVDYGYLTFVHGYWSAVGRGSWSCAAAMICLGACLALLSAYVVIGIVLVYRWVLSDIIKDWRRDLADWRRQRASSQPTRAGRVLKKPGRFVLCFLAMWALWTPIFMVDPNASIRKSCFLALVTAIVTTAMVAWWAVHEKRRPR